MNSTDCIILCNFLTLPQEKFNDTSIYLAFLCQTFTHEYGRLCVSYIVVLFIVITSQEDLGNKFSSRNDTRQGMEVGIKELRSFVSRFVSKFKIYWTMTLWSLFSLTKVNSTRNSFKFPLNNSRKFNKLKLNHQNQLDGNENVKINRVANFNECDDIVSLFWHWIRGKLMRMM